MNKLDEKTSFNLLISDLINPIHKDLGETKNQYSLNKLDILTPKREYEFNKNKDLLKNKKDNNAKQNKRICNDSLKKSKAYSSCNNYWEKRYKDNEIKMEKIKKEKEMKELKELKEKPKISINSKKIIENIRKTESKQNNNIRKINYNSKNNKTVFQKNKLTVSDYLKLKKNMLKNREDIFLRNRIIEKLMDEENEKKKNNKKYDKTNIISKTNNYNFIRKKLDDNYNKGERIINYPKSNKIKIKSLLENTSL